MRICVAARFSATATVINTDTKDARGGHVRRGDTVAVFDMVTTLADSPPAAIVVSAPEPKSAPRYHARSLAVPQSPEAALRGRSCPAPATSAVGEIPKACRLPRRILPGAFALVHVLCWIASFWVFTGFEFEMRRLLRWVLVRRKAVIRSFACILYTVDS